jgi:hypothetical protein
MQTYISFLFCLIVCINVYFHFFSFIITQFQLCMVCTSVLCYRYDFIHFYLYVPYFIVAVIFVGCFTVQRIWAFNTNPEGLMYLVSNPRGHKYELFCGMNINNCLIISILLGYRVLLYGNRKVESDMQCLTFVNFESVYFGRNFSFLLFTMKTVTSYT